MNLEELLEDAEWVEEPTTEESIAAQQIDRTAFVIVAEGLATEKELTQAVREVT